MDSPVSGRVRLGDIIGSAHSNRNTLNTSSLSHMKGNLNYSSNLHDTSPEPFAPMNTTSFPLMSPGAHGQIGSVRRSTVGNGNSLPPSSPAGAVMNDTPYTKIASDRLRDLVTQISPSRESTTTAHLSNFDGGQIQEITSTSPKRRKPGSDINTETITTRRATTMVDNPIRSPPPLRWQPTSLMNSAHLNNLGISSNSSGSYGSNNKYAKNNVNLVSTPRSTQFVTNQGSRSFENHEYVKTEPIVTSSQGIKPLERQTQFTNNLKSSLKIDTNHNNYMNKNTENDFYKENNYSPESSPRNNNNNNSKLSEQSRELHHKNDSTDIREIPFAEVKRVPRNCLKSQHSHEIHQPNLESTKYRNRVISEHQEFLHNKRQMYYQQEMNGIENVPTLYAPQKDLIVYDPDNENGDMCPPPPEFQPDTEYPNIYNTMADDYSQPVMPRMHRKPQRSFWESHPSHDVILLTILARGVTPYSHPDLVEYHMAIELLNSLQKMKTGCYFVNYPRKNGTPHERYFSIRVLPDRFRRMQPYLVWSRHDSSVQILDRVLLTELVHITTGVHSCPAFLRHLGKNYIKGPYVGNQRKCLPFEFAFSLYFINRKTNESRTVNMLSVDKGNYELWLSAMYGILAVNSISVQGENELPANEYEIQRMLAAMHQEDEE